MARRDPNSRVRQRACEMLSAVQEATTTNAAAAAATAANSA